MHVGVDLLFLVPGQTGGRETYVRELLPELRAARPDWRFTGFVSRDATGSGWWTDALDDVVAIEAASGRARGRWALGELALLPRAAKRAQVDLLHSAANFAPVSGSFARVMTVHDVIWRALPGSVGLPVRRATDVLVGTAMHRADRILTPSAASRADIRRLFRVGAQKIDLVPNAARAPARPGDRPRGRVLARVPDGRTLALSVSSNVSHKALDVLVESLAAVKPGSGVVLVLAGRGTEELAGLAATLGVVEDVRLLGAVTQPELEDLFAAADLLVTATRYEGFGLPLVEAMVRDVPVVAPDLPVLREVAGGAARFYPPGDRQALADALAAPPDPALVVAGRERAARFSWATSARLAAESFERALSSRER